MYIFRIFTMHWNSLEFEVFKKIMDEIWDYGIDIDIFNNV